jgi:hypothetical protein
VVGARADGEIPPFQEISMMEWEYYVGRTSSELTALGASGWELVSVTVEDGRPVFYFKRPGSGLKEQVTNAQREKVYSERGLSFPSEGR